MAKLDRVGCDYITKDIAKFNETETETEMQFFGFDINWSLHVNIQPEVSSINEQILPVLGTHSLKPAIGFQTNLLW